jgi:hypothetical protein
LTLLPEPPKPHKPGGHPVTLAAAAQTLLGPGRATVQVTLTRAGRRELRARKRATIVLSASIRTTTGAQLSARRTLRVTK